MEQKLEIDEFYRKQLKDVLEFNICNYDDVSFEFLTKMKGVHQNLTNAIVNGEVTINAPTNTTLDEPQGNLAKLNNMVWQQKIVDKNTGKVYKELNELDCIVVALKRREMEKSKKSDGIAMLVEYDINLRENTVEVVGLARPDDEELILARSDENDRTRPMFGNKGDGVFLNFADKYCSESEIKRYGQKWFLKNKNKNPSCK